MNVNHTPQRPSAPMLLKKSVLIAFVVTIAVPYAQAASYWESYMPPELAYSDDLRQKVTLPGKVNINRASLNQLEVLPGLDEELALKLLRHRPFENFQDFYRMPGVEKKRIDRLIRQLQPKVTFK